MLHKDSPACCQEAVAGGAFSTVVVAAEVDPHRLSRIYSCCRGTICDRFLLQLPGVVLHQGAHAGFQLAQGVACKTFHIFETTESFPSHHRN